LQIISNFTNSNLKQSKTQINKQNKQNKTEENKRENRKEQKKESNFNLNSIIQQNNPSKSK